MSDIPPTNGKAPPRRRKEARPGEIVAAALEIFTDKGFAATRLSEVAARAGVSKGTLYLYFSSKEDLFKTMVREAVLPDIGGLEAWVAAYPGSSAELLRHFILRVARIFSSGPVGRIPKIIIAEAGTFPDLAQFWVTEFVERGQALMRRILERGQASGEFTASQAETVLVLFAPILLLTLWNNAIGPAVGRMLDPGRLADEAARILLDGLRLRDEAP